MKSETIEINMNTDKNTRVAAIICHLNAVVANRHRPKLRGLADLDAMDSHSLLAELESLFADLYPDDAGCQAVLGDFRASLC